MCDFRIGSKENYRQLEGESLAPFLGVCSQDYGGAVTHCQVGKNHFRSASESRSFTPITGKNQLRCQTPARSTFHHAVGHFLKGHFRGAVAMGAQTRDAPARRALLQLLRATVFEGFRKNHRAIQTRLSSDPPLKVQHLVG